MPHGYSLAVPPTVNLMDKDSIFKHIRESLRQHQSPTKVLPAAIKRSAEAKHTVTSASASNGWVCYACTYINDNAMETSCSMCSTTRQPEKADDSSTQVLQYPSAGVVASAASLHATASSPTPMPSPFPPSISAPGAVSIFDMVVRGPLWENDDDDGGEC